MASHDMRPQRSGSRKLQKRVQPHRIPSYQLPPDLRAGDDAQDDVTAPSRSGNPSQYMHQSIFQMITAAGSRTDFNSRFDDTSDSEEEQLEQTPRLSRKGKPSRSSAAAIQEEPESSKESDAKVRKRLSGHSIFKSLARLSSPSRREKKPVAIESPSPPSDEASESSRSHPRDAPVMSRLLTAEAEFQAERLETVESPTPLEVKTSRDRGESSPATLLASRLMEIFGFDKPEKVVAEYPCWLLQSVLLQGYLYITKQHICFYAYLPKKTNTIAKNGYLSKRGRSNMLRYNRYWFKLTGDVLSYAQSPSEQYFSQGHIDLRYGISASLSADKDKQKECCDFSVTTNQKTYHFRADNPASAKEWVQILQKTIFRSHNDGDSVKISLPIDNVIDIEKSSVVEFAETIKIRVIENDESYAIDEYFFTFFTFGEDVLNVLAGLVTGDQTPALVQGLDEKADTSDRRARSPAARLSLDILKSQPRDRSGMREGVKATLTPFDVGDDGKMSPRMSGEFSRSGRSPARASFDIGRASFDRGRRSGSTTRLEVAKEKRTGRSPLARSHESSESQSFDKETDSSTAPLSPRAEAQMSASQILTRSDVFRPAPPRRMDTVPSISTIPTRRSSEIETINSSSPQHETPPMAIRTSEQARDRRLQLQDEEAGGESDSERPGARFSSSPTLQDIMKAGSYPLQRAGAFAGYLKNKSNRMSKLLATESMSYIEKVSGMWAGNRKHYGENETVLPDDQDVDPEDDEANVGYGDRFRAHFALPETEKLQATYFAFLHRVLPLYGKIYISNHKFCFRSLLPGTKTKLILPLKDIENVEKEKGFRFGYHGLVIMIRGHEELFFEFNNGDHRDDCTVMLLKHLNSVKYMEQSGLIGKQEDEDAALAKDEHRLLEEARKKSTGYEYELALPETDRPLYSHDDASPMLFDDPRVSIINFKPTTSLRIVCLTIGSRGDVQPYIALCKGLLAEGHRPKIATHTEFQDWIEGHGIDFAPVDGDPAELMRICIENGMFTYSFLKEAAFKFRGWIDLLLSSSWKACQDADLLIESPSAMSGIHIAEALSVPYYRAFTMPWTRTRAYPHAFAVPEHKMGGAYNYYSYVMFDAVFWKAIAAQVNRWRKKELGLRSTNLDKMQTNKVPFLYNFSPSVVAPPLDYSDWVRVTGYWFLDEALDWIPPDGLIAFLKKAREDNKKIVYIGFGSIVVADPAGLTRTVIDAVVRADVRCVLVKGWSDRLGDPAAPKTELALPPEIYQIRSVPHDWLFKQIDAAVHHGGAGTTGASLRAGLPTVCKPFFGDQFFFGSRVEDLGVGICLKKINVSLLSRAIWEACNSERMIVKARILGEKIRQVIALFTFGSPFADSMTRNMACKQPSKPSGAISTTQRA
jgi:sterol 3beta-glucosyltransferase